MILLITFCAYTSAQSSAYLFRNGLADVLIILLFSYNPSAALFCHAWYPGRVTVTGLITWDPGFPLVLSNGGTGTGRWAGGRRENLGHLSYTSLTSYWPDSGLTVTEFRGVLSFPFPACLGLFSHCLTLFVVEVNASPMLLVSGCFTMFGLSSLWPHSRK